MSIYIKNLKHVRYAYIHMMYDVFLLFFTYVVADVDEFSVHSSPQSRTIRLIKSI
jgi:hypothetical protein